MTREMENNFDAMRLELYELIEAFRDKHKVHPYVIGELLNVHQSTVASWKDAIAGLKEKLFKSRYGLDREHGQLKFGMQQSESKKQPVQVHLPFDFESDDDDYHDTGILKKSPAELKNEGRIALVKMLEAYRVTHCLTQHEIACMLGLTQTAYSAWIVGRTLPQASSLWKIQSFLCRELQKEGKL